MRTLFLLGILGALVVIATKKDNQTAMEAAMEIGQKAKAVVSEYDKAKIINAVSETVKDVKKAAKKEAMPFIQRTNEAIAKSEKSLAQDVPEPKTYISPEKVVPPVALKPIAKKKTLSEEPEWTMQQPGKLAIPDILAMPKASVEKLEIGADVVVKVAKVEPAAIDVGRSYDMVKGYYENASRLLEEIK
jgi:hypothetical protein